MKIKPEYLGLEIYSTVLGNKIEVKESNIELLKSLGINYIFEVEESQPKKK
jgi:hypothetical protein